MKPEIKDLIEISRYYGQQKEYVIAGGGNTSYKDEKHLWIKASGVNLGSIDENGFCKLDRDKLNEIAQTQFSTDVVKREEEVKKMLMNSRVNPESGLRPSVETSLHNLFEASLVVHTHPTLVNGLMCSNLAEEKTRELFGQETLYIPYTDPGYILFSFVNEKLTEYREKFDADPKIVMIQNHGLFVAADSADEIKGIHAGIESKLKSSFGNDYPKTEELPVSDKLADALPALRMLLSEDELKTATAFHNTRIADFIQNKESFEKGIARPFNPDQMVYCLSEYLFIEHCETAEDIIAECKTATEEFNRAAEWFPKSFL